MTSDEGTWLADMIFFFYFVHRIIFNKTRHFRSRCASIFGCKSTYTDGLSVLRMAVSKGSTSVDTFFTWREKQNRLPKHRALFKNWRMYKVQKKKRNKKAVSVRTISQPLPLSISKYFQHTSKKCTSDGGISGLVHRWILKFCNCLSLQQLLV